MARLRAPGGFSPEDMTLGPAAMAAGPQAAGGAVNAFRRLFQMLRQPRGPRPGPELANMLRQVGGTPGPSPFRTLLERSRAGEIDRPWVGTKSIYQTEGKRVLPRSYQQPREYYMEP